MSSGRSGLRLRGPTADASHHRADRAPRQGYRSAFGGSEFGPPRPFRRVSMCRPAHRSIRCRSRWAQGTCLSPIMTITPWCSPIERPGLLGRETGTGKFVTRVQVMLNSAAIARPLRVSGMYRDPRRKWCSSSIESAIRTQTRLHHLIDTSKVGRRPTWKRFSMRPPRAIGSQIRSSEVSMAGRCTNTSISWRTDSPVQERSVGASSLSSCEAQ
jgi:hypothetical protein